MHLFGIHNYWLLILSGILLNMTPGQDTLYIVGRSISQGRRAGVLSVLGISTGCLVHTLAAAFGLSAVLAALSETFMVVKFIGAGYLNRTTQEWHTRLSP
jgi:threonine/homoserine/homoserine lactone efflux protein